MSDSSIVEKDQPCPKCGSSDALQIYDDGHGYCFSGACNTYFSARDLEKLNATESSETTETAFEPVSNASNSSFLSFESIGDLPTKGFRERAITKPVAEFFGVKARLKGESISDHFYPYTRNGEVVAFKQRICPKEGWNILGDFKDVELFGQDKFVEGGKRLVITEGECDAMAYAQASQQQYGKIYPVVSLPSASGTKALEKNRNWIRTFDEVILWIDNDEAGENALRKAAKIIGYDKVKIAKSIEKDANDTLLKQGFKETLNAVWNATQYSPAGVITDPEVLWEQLEEYNKIESVPYPACLEGLNDKVKGMRPGEITLWTSGTGSGKSTLLREIMLHLIQTTDDKIGLVSLEEAPAEAARKLAGMAIKKNPAKEEIPLEDLRPGFDEVFGEGRVIVLDHQGAMNDGSIVETLESMCVMGAKYLFVDHITILVSEGAEGLTGNEAIDKVMNDLLSIAKRHQVWIGLVSHLRKTTTVGTSFEDGKLASLDDIRGSGSIKQISFDILAFARDLNAENEAARNTIKMAVLKSRYTGLTGPCGTAVYNYDTGRLSYGGLEFDEEDSSSPFSIDL